jgi:hypothetical protein
VTVISDGILRLGSTFLIKKKPCASIDAEAGALLLYRKKKQSVQATVVHLVAPGIDE